MATRMGETPDTENANYSDLSAAEGEWASSTEGGRDPYSMTDDEREWLHYARRSSARRAWAFITVIVSAVLLLILNILQLELGITADVIREPNRWLVGVGLGLITLATIAAISRWRSRSWMTKRQLENQLKNARYDLKLSLVHTAILPFLRDTLSRRLQSYDSELRVNEAPGLSEVFESVYEIPIAATTQLRRLLDRVPGGSIGISGPRGAGKTTLIRSFCHGKNAFKGPRLSAMVSAPAEYTARDFVLHLFATLCQEVLGQVDEDPLTLRRQEIRSGLSGWYPTGMRILGLYGGLLLIGGIGMLGLFAGQVRVDPRVAWGTALMAAGVVLLAISRPFLGLKQQERRLPESDDERDLLLIVASRRLQEIQFQQTTSSGWSGAAKSPVGLEASLTGGATLARVQLSFPEIVSMLRRFLKLATTRGPVVIGIDELDKLPTDDRARQFLNEIKAIFGVKNCYYLVSISEEAMASFERRGLPFRDVFDSTFDEVIRVPYLSMADAQRLLNRRVVLPMPFVCFCYCLSGGLARDLIRIARRIVDAQPSVASSLEGSQSYPVRLEDAVRELIEEQIRTKSEATMSVLRSIDAEPEVSEALQWCSRVKVRPVTASLLLEQCERFAREAQPQPSHTNEQVSVERQALYRVVSGLVGYYYYAATMLEFFAVAPDEERITRSLRSQEGDGSLEQLASCQQAFSINPRIAWTLLSAFREAWRLRTVEFPGVFSWAAGRSAV